MALLNEHQKLPGGTGALPAPLLLLVPPSSHPTPTSAQHTPASWRYKTQWSERKSAAGQNAAK